VNFGRNDLQINSRCEVPAWHDVGTTAEAIVFVVAALKWIAVSWIGCGCQRRGLALRQCAIRLAETWHTKIRRSPNQQGERQYSSAIPKHRSRLYASCDLRSSYED
jgi:hypothetical protein